MPTTANTPRKPAVTSSPTNSPLRHPRSGAKKVPDLRRRRKGTETPGSKGKPQGFDPARLPGYERNRYWHLLRLTSSRTRHSHTDPAGAVGTTYAYPTFSRSDSTSSLGATYIRPPCSGAP